MAKFINVTMYVGASKVREYKYINIDIIAYFHRSIEGTCIYFRQLVENNPCIFVSASPEQIMNLINEANNG